MEPPRFFCPQLLGESSIVLDAAEARHALQSRRLGHDDPVRLFDGNGTLALGRLDLHTRPDEAADRAARRGVTVRIDHTEQVARPTRRLTLVTGACKGDRIDELVEQCTQLGVTRLVFAAFQHSVVLPGPGHITKLRRKAIEACKQCGRAWLPAVLTATTLDEWTAAPRCAVGGSVDAPETVQAPQTDAPKADAHAKADAKTARSGSLLLLVTDPTAPREKSAFAILSHAAARQVTDIVAFVGPEGGIAPDEMNSLRRAGAAAVWLGPHTLRVETAAVSVAAAWAATL